MSTSRARYIISKFTSCMLDGRDRSMVSDVHPRWQRHHEVLDLGSDSAQFVLPVGAVADKLWASHLSWAAPLGIYRRLRKIPFLEAGLL